MKTIISIILFFLGNMPNGPADIFEAVRSNDLSAVSYYLEKGTSVDTANADGSTPLILAAYYDQGEMVDLLIEKKADTELQNKMGNTALMGVCFKGYTSIAKKLLEAGSNPNQRNFNDATALIFASTFGHVEIVILLLRHGADKTLRDRFGNNAMDHALMQENEEIIRILGQ